MENVCSYRKGRAKVKKAQYLSTENILQNYAGIEPYDDLTETEGISIQSGDTLMANIRPYLRKVWQSEFDGACSTDVLAFSPDNIDGNFLYFLIAQDRFVNYVMCGAKGSKMPRGDKNHILEYETGVPTESEQRKIAHFIDLLNARISSQNSLINLFKKYKRGALSALFPKKGEITPQFRFAGFTKPWEQRKLGDLVDVCSGRDYKHLSEGDIPVYGTGGYMLSVSEALSYDKDAIGIGRKGTIDKPYILNAPFWTVDTLFYAIPREKIDLNFAFDIFQNIDWKKKDESTGVPSLSKTAINEIEVLVPQYDEQQALGQFFNGIDNLITIHQHKCYSLLSLKNALLQQMFI